jgi:phosphoribosylanthranilate isomerase
VIKAFGIDEQFDFDILSVYEPYVDYFLFDTKTKDYGGSGRVYDWSVLNQYKGEKPYFLSGGIGKENIEHAFEFEDERKQVLDLNSKFEIEAGLKDIDLLRTKVFAR